MIPRPIWADTNVASIVKIILDQKSSFEARSDARIKLIELKEKGAEAVPLLIKALDDKNKYARQNAIEALGLLGVYAKDTVPLLIQILSQNKDSFLRIEAAKSLGRMKAHGRKAVPALIKALKEDKERFVRTAAARTLGFLGVYEEEAISALGHALSNDSEDRVKKEAVSSLWLLGEKTPEAVPVLSENVLNKNLSNEIRDSIVGYLEAIARNTKHPIPISITSPPINNSCKAICALYDNLEKYWYPKSAEEARRYFNSESYGVAVQSLQSLFLLKAAPYCSKRGNFPYVQKSMDGIEDSIKKILAEDPDDWGNMEAYAAQYALLLGNNLDRSNPIATHQARLRSEQLKRLKQVMNGTFVGRLDSTYNTYAFAGIVATLDDPSKEVMTHLKRVAKALDDPMKVPYSPRIGRSDSKRGAAARAVPFYLALYRHEKNDKEKETYKALLIKSLQLWFNYSGALYVHQYRNDAHKGADGLAPYYFAPSVPYVSAALFELLQNGKLSQGERSDLMGLKPKIEKVVLASVDKEGLARKIGSGTQRTHALYLSSHHYVNPLIGLGLLPFASEEACGKGLGVATILNGKKPPTKGDLKRHSQSHRSIRPNH